MPRPAPDRTDPWAPTWVGTVTVAAVFLTIIVATISTVSGTDAGCLAAAWCYGLGGLVLAVIRGGELAQAARHRRALQRAFGDQPPGPAELADDFAAAAVRFPYPPDTEG